MCDITGCSLHNAHGLTIFRSQLSIQDLHVYHLGRLCEAPEHGENLLNHSGQQQQHML